MEIARLKEELIQQRKSKFKGNIYHYSQVNFAYNSNKIEGGRLSEDETEEIFETDSFIPKSDETIKLDDLIEMKNHFRLFDYALDTLNDDLSKEMIINMNKILKRNTTDEENPRYNVGGFKIIPNKIGLINVIDTSAPEDVEKDIGNLLLEYKKIKNIYMETNSFKNTSDILKYIDYITDKKEVCLLGSGNILEEVFLNLEDKFNKKTYIFKNHETYIITSEKG